MDSYINTILLKAFYNQHIIDSYSFVYLSTFFTIQRTGFGFNLHSLIGGANIHDDGNDENRFVRLIMNSTLDLMDRVSN